VDRKGAAAEHPGCVRLKGRLEAENKMHTDTTSRSTVLKRATDELKEYAIIAAYLYVSFTAIMYLKSTILRAYGVEFAPFGFAAIKALISAKFVSVG
jgi:hypothetical protein